MSGRSSSARSRNPPSSRAAAGPRVPSERAPPRRWPLARHRPFDPSCGSSLPPLHLRRRRSRNVQCGARAPGPRSPRCASPTSTTARAPRTAPAARRRARRPPASRPRPRRRRARWRARSGTAAGCGGASAPRRARSRRPPRGRRSRRRRSTPRRPEERAASGRRTGCMLVGFWIAKRVTALFCAMAVRP